MSVEVRTLPDGTLETTNGCLVCKKPTTWRQSVNAQWRCTRCGTAEDEEERVVAQRDADPKRMLLHYAGRLAITGVVIAVLAVGILIIHIALQPH